MENKAEDEVRKQWEKEAKDAAEKEEGEQQRGKKRPRLLWKEAATGGESVFDRTVQARAHAAVKRGKRKAKGRVEEVEGEEVIEVD